MAKMGRPKEENPADRKITARFNEKEYARLVEYASRHNLTMTQLIKQSVEEKIKTDESDVNSFL